MSFNFDQSIVIITTSHPHITLIAYLHPNNHLLQCVVVLISSIMSWEHDTCCVWCMCSQKFFILFHITTCTHQHAPHSPDTLFPSISTYNAHCTTAYNLELWWQRAVFCCVWCKLVLKKKKNNKKITPYNIHFKFLPMALYLSLCSACSCMNFVTDGCRECREGWVDELGRRSCVSNHLCLSIY